MRGFPPLQALIILLILSGMIPTLLRLTQAKPVEMVQVNPSSGSKATHLLACHVEMRFAHRPIKLEIRQADKLLFQFKNSDLSPLSTEFDITLDEGAADLRVSATWPKDSPDTALTLTLRPDQLDEIEHTLWGQGELDTLTTFLWKEGTK